MDNLTHYKRIIDQLKFNINEVDYEKIKNYGLFGNFKIVSANLSLFLPSIQKNQHLDLIKDIHLYRSWAIYDQEFLFLLDNLKIIDTHKIIDKCRKKSYIFTTYHTGSYRLLIALFAKLNIKFCLVTEQNFIDTQGDIVKGLYKKVKYDLNNNKEDELEILNAENPNLILRLARKLRNKYSIVFYIDGNTGTNDFSLEKEKMLKIKFLNHYIYARKGIGYLSHLTKTPIVSVIGKRIDDVTSDLVFKEIKHNNFSNKRNNYVNYTTRELYNILENFISCYPEQWEGWFYIHKFIDTKKDNVFIENSDELDLFNIKTVFNKKIKFNDFDFEIIKYDGDNFFLINRKNYSVSKITPALYKIINYFSKPRIISELKPLKIGDVLLKETAFKELFLMDMLKPE